MQRRKRGAVVSHNVAKNHIRDLRILSQEQDLNFLVRNLPQIKHPGLALRMRVCETFFFNKGSLEYHLSNQEDGKVKIRRLGETFDILKIRKQIQQMYKRQYSNEQFVALETCICKSRDQSIQLMNDHALFQLMQKRKNDPVIKDLLYIQIIRQNPDTTLDKLLLRTFIFDHQAHLDDPKFRKAQNGNLVFNGDVDHSSAIYKEQQTEESYV